VVAVVLLGAVAAVVVVVVAAVERPRSLSRHIGKWVATVYSYAYHNVQRSM